MNDQTLDLLFSAADMLRSTEHLLVQILEENMIEAAESARCHIDGLRAYIDRVEKAIAIEENKIQSQS